MDSIEIKGKTYTIEKILTRNRTAIARLKEETIVISIPSRWSRKDKDKTFQNLLKRSVWSIEKGRWTVEGSKKLDFSHGQKLKAMGKKFEIVFSTGKRFRARPDAEKTEIIIPEHAQKNGKASAYVRKHVVKALMPGLKERIRRYNDLHFNAMIKKITIRDNLTLWGSCSTDGTISLNFRLLFMPQGVLDYVIVHELAHTKYKSHGKRFWGLVERAVPDYEEQKTWLRKNGWSIFTDSSQKTGQMNILDFIPQ